MNEQDLIRRIRNVDPEIYGQLIDRYRGKVMRTCFSYLRNERDAEEAVQDIFAKAYFSLAKFKGDSSFSTWIYRIAVNHCLDILRKKYRRRSVSLEALTERTGDRFPDRSGAAERTVTDPENHQLVHRILSILPTDHRTILLLKVGGGFKVREIAQVMVCTPRSVRRRSSKAWKRILENRDLICA